MRSESVAMTVLNGATASNAVDLRDYELRGFYFPAAMTSVALTLESCHATDGSETMRAVADSAGAAVTITIAGTKYVVLTEAHRLALSQLGRTRCILGAAEGADRTFRLLVSPRP